MAGSSFNGTGSSRYGRLVFFPAGDRAGLAVLHLLPLHMAHGSQGTHSRRRRKLTVVIVMRQVEESYRVEERYRVEKPKWVREQTIAFGLR